jgi:hypothetical protein
MCDEAFCARLSVGPARVSIEALLELRAVLSTVAPTAELPSKWPTKEGAANEAESELQPSFDGARSVPLDTSGFWLRANIAIGVGVDL